MTSREATAAAHTYDRLPAVPAALEQAEAALVEHYPRLVRIAYLVLPPAHDRSRRVLTAHALAQRALPRGDGRRTAPVPGPDGLGAVGSGAHVPAPRGDGPATDAAEPGAGPGAGAGIGAGSGAGGDLLAGGDPGAVPGLGAGTAEASYAFLRLRVLRAALDAGRPRAARGWPLAARHATPRGVRLRVRLRPVLPRVWGLRLFPRSGGADELALDQSLSALPAPARAAYVLRGLERLADRDVRRLLEAAGVRDARRALLDADRVRLPGGSRDEVLLESPEFDPCCLQVRPTDLLRRRSRLRAAVAATAAVAVCGTLFGLPVGGWGREGAAEPSPGHDRAAGRVLDPAALLRAAPAAWHTSDRTDFTVWPARGRLIHDRALVRRALTAWARPDRGTRVTATPGTATGPPPGPAQLLYAGDVGAARVVVLYDGLRVVRYAEPRRDADPGATGKAADTGMTVGTGTGTAYASRPTTGAVLDFARTDGADTASATALVVGRAEGRVRYLTAPWVSAVRLRDLLRPDGGTRAVHRGEDGVTEPVPSPGGTAPCGPSTRRRDGTDGGRPGRGWPVLEVRTASVAGSGRVRRLLTDLGELTPARLTYGSPAQPPRDVSGGTGRDVWARTACHLPAVRSRGIRAVNSWMFAEQPLPDSDRTAAWVCTRAETWRGGESTVMAQFQPPAEVPGEPGTVVARAQNSPACGARSPRVLAGVLWKSLAGQWYVLAAGSPQVSSITASGGVRGQVVGNVLALPAGAGARAELDARLANGASLAALR